MKQLSSLTHREMIILLVGLNLLLKLIFIFLRVYPDDVEFYQTTGWFLSNDVLPYQGFETGKFYLFPNSVHRVHPNGPLNYLLYWAIMEIFGVSIPATKLPLLLAEITIAVYILKIGELFSKSEHALIIALGYTISIQCYYSGILLGCDELITGAFAIASIYYFFQERPVTSGFLLGLGISYKLYPIFFLLSMFPYCYHNKRLGQFAILLGVGLITYVIVALPYLLLCPDLFLKYNLGQANRFITISFGNYLKETWFYQPLFTIPLIFIDITPHFIFEVIIMGGYLIWDIIISKKKHSYGHFELIRAMSYYVAMLPVVSLSYNYRYFQWVLPLFLFFYYFEIKNERLSHNLQILISFMDIQ